VQRAAAKEYSAGDGLNLLQGCRVPQGSVCHEGPEARRCRLRASRRRKLSPFATREWLGLVGVKSLYIEPGSPWENGYVWSFNGKLRDELLAHEEGDTLLEAKLMIERRRKRLTTPSDRTECWVIAARPRSHTARFRLLRLRLSKRTWEIPWQGNPGD